MFTLSDALFFNRLYKRKIMNSSTLFFTFAFCIMSSSTFAAEASKNTEAPWYKDSSSDEEDETSLSIEENDDETHLFTERDFFWKSNAQKKPPVIDATHPLLQKTFSELQHHAVTLKQQLDMVGLEIVLQFTFEEWDLNEKFNSKKILLAKLKRNKNAQLIKRNKEVIKKIQNSIDIIEQSMQRDEKEFEKINYKKKVLNYLLHVPLEVSVTKKTMEKCKHFFYEDTAKAILIYYIEKILDEGIEVFQNDRKESIEKKLATLSDEKIKQDVKEKLQNILTQKNLQKLEELLISLHFPFQKEEKAIRKKVWFPDQQVPSGPKPLLEIRLF